MKYFKFIANLDITAALNEVETKDYYFKPHTPKPEQSPPLREGRSIHLRIHDHAMRNSELSNFYGAKEQADKMLSAIDSTIYNEFPNCRALIESAMQLIPEGILGRCYIAKMTPGKNVYPHIDPGKYFELHDRYHIVLKTNEKVSFSCGNENIENDVETVRFAPGELWVFNNKVTHWASNLGDTDRIHLIMDVRHDKLHFT